MTDTDLEHTKQELVDALRRRAAELEARRSSVRRSTDHDELDLRTAAGPRRTEAERRERPVAFFASDSFRDAAMSSCSPRH